jgi:hypothetical protein
MVRDHGLEDFEVHQHGNINSLHPLEEILTATP